MNATLYLNSIYFYSLNYLCTVLCTYVILNICLLYKMTSIHKFDILKKETSDKFYFSAECILLKSTHSIIYFSLARNCSLRIGIFVFVLRRTENFFVGNIQPLWASMLHNNNNNWQVFSCIHFKYLIICQCIYVFHIVWPESMN